MALSKPSAMAVDAPTVAPCVFFIVPTDTGFIRYNPFSRSCFYDTVSLVCLLAIRFIESYYLTMDDRNNVHAYNRRNNYTAAATHVLESPFVPTEAEKDWWLAKYSAHRQRQKRIMVNKSFLMEVSAIERVVVNRLRADMKKKAESEKRAKELEGAVISSKRRLPLDDESDDVERNAKRQRQNNGRFSKKDQRLDPGQVAKCRFDVVNDEVPKLCDCKRGCSHIKRNYYYNNALEKVPIVYPVIIPQPSKSQAAVTAVLLEGSTDDTADGVVVTSAKDSHGDPSFATVHMKRMAATFTRKDARKRMEWRKLGWKEMMMGSALKFELELAPSEVTSGESDELSAASAEEYLAWCFQF